MNGWTLSEFLAHIRSLDIRLALDGDRLAVNAPKGAVTADIKAELQGRKADILEFLRAHPETFAATTVTATAAPVNDIRHAAPITPIDRSATLPLSFSQQRLWFLDRMEPGSPIYNVSSMMRLRGPLDRTVLEQSIRAIIDRHESLRTVFRERDGVPDAVIGDAGAWRLDVVDLRAMPDTEREADALGRVQRETRRAYELATGPLVRTTLFVLRDDEHLLLVGMHHIIADERSMSVFWRELSQLYPAFRDSALQAGAASPLAPLPVHYVDYAAWHRRWLESGVLGMQLPYWKEALASPLPVLELPLDRPRPPVQTHQGDVSVFSLSSAVSNAVQQFSAREQVTPFVTLLAAFELVLARYSGQDDIIVGTATAGRNHPALEDLIGFFANTLVLRTSTSGNPTVREYVQRVHATTRGAFAHQDVPFDRLLDVLKPERSLDRSPVFQTMFVLHDKPVRAMSIGELQATPVEIRAGVSPYDVNVDVELHDGTFQFRIEFSTDLFDAASIARMQQHYQTALSAMLDAPDQRLSEIPLLTPAESRQLLVEWNTTSAAYPSSACVHELIAEQVARMPEREAVRFGETALTYRELDRRANQLAHWLHANGVGPNLLVGVCVERTHEMLVAVLAVWKAGGAYVPLDPSYPAERLAFMAQDAGLVALITEEALLPTVPSPSCPVICIDRDREVLAKEPAAAPAVESSARQLAYVIYTSGSTGTPKGVEIEHRSVVNFLYAMQREPGLRSDDVLLSVTTLSFDIAGLELYLPLLVGARIVLASRTLAADGPMLAQSIDASGITVMQATPATWRLLLDAGWNGKRGLKILCGGEALPNGLAKQLLATGAELWNMYGPTETTIWSAVYRVQGNETTSAIPIGKPIANTLTYVLDANGAPVPVNVAGELYIGGDGVARGYHNRPELTTERFVANPFACAVLSAKLAIEATANTTADASAHDDARMYRTGDKVRYRPNGTLEYLGRLDNQVKLRGYRIELGEIESILAEHEGVRQAVVAIREDMPGDQRLVAYVVSNAGTVGSNTEEIAGDTAESLTSASLRAAMSERLPAFMIPSAFVLVDAIPLTPNGKIDLRALANADGGTQLASAASVPPRPGIETAVAQVWCETLHLDHVWADDNFFDIGGNSLLGIRLLANLEKAVGRRLPVSILFQGQTVRAMAEALGGDLDDVTSLAVPLRATASGKQPLFLVPGIDGDVIGYDALARAIETENPVYGLRSVGLDGDTPPLERIEEIASRFIEEMRRVQPHGPYAIGGFCIGGIVSYEIARQLHAQNEEVNLLVLIATWPPAVIMDTVSTSRWMQQLLFLREGVGRHLRALWNRPLSQQIPYFLEKGRIVGEMLAKRDVYRGDTVTLARDLVTRANQRAAARYALSEYPGGVAVIVTDKSVPPEYESARLYWLKLAQGKSTTITVPGTDSGSLLKPPYRQGLVDALRNLLNSLEQST